MSKTGSSHMSADIHALMWLFLLFALFSSPFRTMVIGKTVYRADNVIHTNP